jgi:ABC-2 type transport system ATP-binding protein
MGGRMKYNIIQTSNLSKSFNGVEALKSLALNVPTNSIFGFLGPNGAGKTTAMKLLLGLLRPTQGGGTIFGLDIVKDSVEIRTRIGYLPQDPRFYEFMTARETLEFTANFYFKGPKKEIDKRIVNVLELVGLEDKSDRAIKSFSGGERQRLGIAQAQVNFPDLLILDEPAASLDPLGRRDVLAVMERLQKHTTIFYSTHILDDVQQVSDMVAILNKGELIVQGPIDELLAGGKGVVYSVRISGNGDGARQRLANQPWISEVRSVDHDEETRLTISVSDEELARARLLRLLLEDPQLLVTDFRRKEYELEEVFINIIEGGQYAGE